MSTYILCFNGKIGKIISVNSCKISSLIKLLSYAFSTDSHEDIVAQILHAIRLHAAIKLRRKFNIVKSTRNNTTSISCGFETFMH